MKEIKRSELFELRNKYAAIYNALESKLPAGDYIYGSHAYVLAMGKILSECKVYDQAIKDIDAILGV